MFDVMIVLIRSLFSGRRTRRELIVENLALRHQLHVLNRKSKHPSLTSLDRLLWVLLPRIFDGWNRVLVVVEPETVIRWHRKAFQIFWRWKSQLRGGRPRIDPERIQLIRRRWQSDPVWGCIRIRDELAKLGIRVSESTIRKYRPRH